MGSNQKVKEITVKLAMQRIKQDKYRKAHLIGFIPKITVNNENTIQKIEMETEKKTRNPVRATFVETKNGQQNISARQDKELVPNVENKTIMQ